VQPGAKDAVRDAVRGEHQVLVRDRVQMEQPAWPRVADGPRYTADASRSTCGQPSRSTPLS
jgi:hypothetical protein